MSPRFYGFLWVIFFVSASILWLANVLTLLAVVVFGFMAFGLIFIGMMCVLPGTVAHPPSKDSLSASEWELEPAVRPVKAVARPLQVGLRLR